MPLKPFRIDHEFDTRKFDSRVRETEDLGGKKRKTDVKRKGKVAMLAFVRTGKRVKHDGKDCRILSTFGTLARIHLSFTIATLQACSVGCFTSPKLMMRCPTASGDQSGATCSEAITSLTCQLVVVHLWCGVESMQTGISLGKH